MELAFFNDFIKPYFLKELKENKSEDIQRKDFYPIFEKFATGVIFCFAKKKTESEMALFAASDPDLITIGLMYCGEKDLSIFWSSIEEAMKFNSGDFYTIIDKANSSKKKKKKNLDSVSKLGFEIDKDGYVCIVLSGTRGLGKSCLKIDGNGNLFDSVIKPDSLLGSVIHASNVNRFKRWVINKIKEDKDFV